MPRTVLLVHLGTCEPGIGRVRRDVPYHTLISPIASFTPERAGLGTQYLLTAAKHEGIIGKTMENIPPWRTHGGHVSTFEFSFPDPETKLHVLHREIGSHRLVLINQTYAS